MGTYALRYADEQTKRAVFNKGRVIPNLDPSMWRADVCGAYMYYPDHGSRNDQYGWEIDHIFPKALGGSDRLENLQPLQWENNAAKGDTYGQWSCARR